jgi:serine protease Do
MKGTLFRIVMSALIVVAVAGTTWSLAPEFMAKLAYAQEPGAKETGEALAARKQLEEEPATGPVDFRQVAKAIAPSVVNISTIKKIRIGPAVPDPGMLQSPMHRFFGDEFFQRFFAPGLPQQPRQAEQRALGTGVIIGKDGHVLTNNHVIREADEISVNLADGRTLKASVVGTDTKTDLAVLKVDADGLLPAELGNSDEIEVGEWVLAVGNPFGLRNTFTSGIVSAKGRADIGIARYEDFIQTDAAINPGNSGGPLVNLSGKVVGINTAIASRSGGYQGIGFAIPSNMARDVMNSLIKHGRVERGWLGVYIQNLDGELSKSFGFDGQGGILVSQVVEGGPGHEAGLRSGDIIITLDGKPVKSTNSFSSAIASLGPGGAATLEVFRNGERMKLAVEVSNYPDEDEMLRSPSAGNLGVKVKTLTPDLAGRYGAKAIRGVIITGVETASLAAIAGIRVGDVIVSVNGEVVANVSEFHAAVQKGATDGGVRLLVESQGRRRFVILNPGR